MPLPPLTMKESFGFLTIVVYADLKLRSFLPQPSKNTNSFKEGLTRAAALILSTAASVLNRLIIWSLNFFVCVFESGSHVARVGL